jgi:hypothetical protein
MKVLLRHAGMSLYYAGCKHWVGDLDSAMDLGEIERAVELSREEAFTDLEILVSYGEPDCELVLPLSPKKTADHDITPASA